METRLHFHPFIVRISLLIQSYPRGGDLNLKGNKIKAVTQACKTSMFHFNVNKIHEICGASGNSELIIIFINYKYTSKYQK